MCTQNKQKRKRTKIITKKKKKESTTEKVIQVDSIYLLNNLKNYDEKLIIQSHIHILGFHETSQGYIRVD